ncbi:hypothetical protein [Formosa sp. S-31]|uniref:hypothetical protein n=1 Tax=Formosa sp. S-31 TaxID=2790949 RepID=UPI003EBD4FAD
MNFNEESVLQGLMLAKQKYETEYDTFLLEGVFNNIKNDIFYSINIYNVGEDYLDRFILLYSEILGLAQMVRVHNSEPLLQKEDLISGFAFLANIMNSFKHD